MAVMRIAVAAVLAVSLAAPAAELLPLSEVRPGMQGVGRTVFEGARVDEFGVHILGVLENAVGPRQSLIVARLEGGPLAETGVIAGMSGSPVFIDGKKAMTLRGPNIAEDFQKLVLDYIENRYGKGRVGTAAE